MKNEINKMHKVQGTRKKDFIGVTGLLLVACSLFLVFFSSSGCNIYKFTEAGPGKILQGLVLKIDKMMEVEGVS